MSTHTTKGKVMIYLSDDDMKKLDDLVQWMDADSMTETVRRLIREKHRELAEIKTK